MCVLTSHINSNFSRYQLCVFKRQIHITLRYRWGVGFIGGWNNKYYIFWVCVCCLSYPICNVCAPYCHLGPVWLYNFLWCNFRRKLLNVKCVCCCSGQILSEFFFVYGVLFCDLICVLIFVFNVHLLSYSYHFLLIICAVKVLLHCFEGYVLAISYYVLHCTEVRKYLHAL
jgi:hypothetical protein